MVRAGPSRGPVRLQSHFLWFQYPNWCRASLLVVEMCGYPSDLRAPQPSHQYTTVTAQARCSCWALLVSAPVKKVEVLLLEAQSDCSGVVLGQLFLSLLLLLTVLSGNNQGVRVAHHHLQNTHMTQWSPPKGPEHVRPNQTSVEPSHIQFTQLKSELCTNWKCQRREWTWPDVYLSRQDEM